MPTAAPRFTRSFASVRAIAGLLLAATGCLLFTPMQSHAAQAPLVVIDPGHGGPYSNANANGLKEKNVNLAIGLELRRQLNARGYRVTMTRTTDRALVLGDIKTWNWSEGAQLWRYSSDGKRGYVSGIPKDDLQARANLANQLGADVFISIHNNGSVNRSVRGTEVYASRRDRLGRALSEHVLERIVARTGLRNRGTHTEDFFVCRWTNMPSILVEGGYISNPADARLLASSAFRRRLAVGIAEGLDEWYADRPFTATRRPVRASSPSAAAVAASRLRFATGADTVLIARADRWRDAPAAPALATKLRAPLLWAEGSGVSSDTAAELRRLAPNRVVLVGVNGSLDTTLAASVASAAAVPPSALDRIEARDRIALAARIADYMGPARVRHVFIADAADTTSLRVLAPAAAAHRIPLLLTDGGALSNEGRRVLGGRLRGTTRVILFGSATDVPARVAGGAPAVRCDGYLSQRAAWLNSRYYGITAASRIKPILADTASPAGYLTAASYAATPRRPVLPVAGRAIAPYTRLWITNLRPQLVGFEVFDASRSVPANTEHSLRKMDAE